MILFIKKLSPRWNDAICTTFFFQQTQRRHQLHAAISERLVTPIKKKHTIPPRQAMLIGSLPHLITTNNQHE